MIPALGYFMSQRAQEKSSTCTNDFLQYVKSQLQFSFFTGSVLSFHLKGRIPPQVFIPGTRVRTEMSHSLKKTNKPHLICRKTSVLIKNILYHNQIQLQLKGNLFSGVLLL